MNCTPEQKTELEALYRAAIGAKERWDELRIELHGSPEQLSTRKRDQLQADFEHAEASYGDARAAYRLGIIGILEGEMNEARDAYLVGQALVVDAYEVMSHCSEFLRSQAIPTGLPPGFLAKINVPLLTGDHVRDCCTNDTSMRGWLPDFLSNEGLAMFEGREYYGESQPPKKPETFTRKLKVNEPLGYGLNVDSLKQEDFQLIATLAGLDKKPRQWAPHGRMLRDAQQCPCFSCPSRPTCKTECQTFQKYRG